MIRINFWKVVITTDDLGWPKFFTTKPSVDMLRDALMLDVAATINAPRVFQLNTLMEVVEHLPANYANGEDRCDYSVRVAGVEIGRVNLNKLEGYDVQT